MCDRDAADEAVVLAALDDDIMLEERLEVDVRRGLRPLRRRPRQRLLSRLVDNLNVLRLVARNCFLLFHNLKG